ncbi:MAG: hypothetical protein QXY49_07300 [Thermofilaceae archaeon]
MRSSTRGLNVSQLSSMKCRPPVSAKLRKLLTYAYNNLNHVTFIVAGSEVGMPRDFLKFEASRREA